MDIPEGARVCCAADLFEYDEDKALNFQKFFTQYKDQFPMLIVIIGGFYGTTKLDCYDNLQVLRVHCYTSQHRVLVEDSRLNPTVRVGCITIPEDTKIPFRVVKGHTRMGNPQPLKEILEEHKTLPLLLQLACEPQYPVKVGMSRHVARDFGNIFVKERFTEHFFIMNSIDGVELDMNKLTCMACLSEELEATPVTGFKYKSKAEFDEFCRKLSKDVAESGEVYDTSAGNGDFAEYSFDDMRNLLAVAEYKTGTMTEKTDTEDSDSGDDYEEVPPVPPPRDSPRDTDQNQSEANIIPEKSHNAKHFFTSKLQHTKSPKGAETAKETKGKFGFFKKKHREEADKTDGTPIKKTVKPNTTAHKTDVQDAEIHRNPPELPPHVPVKSLSQTTDQTNNNTHADGGYTIQANSRYQNTKIGRAAVKPMPRENVEQNSEDDLKKQLEEEEQGDYEVLGEVQSAMSEKHSASENSGQSKVEPLRLQNECQQIMTDPDYDPDDMYEDMSAVPDSDYLEPRSPVDKTLEENDDKQHYGNHQQMSDASQLSIKEVGEKLTELKLEKYAVVFEENQVDGEILISLSVDDLVNELGLKKLEALRLYKFATTGHIPR